MKITPYGSALEVTGSNYHLVTEAGTQFLIDFGLFQGGPQVSRRNSEPLAFDPAALDFVILTHAHIDHSGRLPLLAKHGFKGKVFMTYPTRDLVEPLLLDSAKIQSEETEEMIYTLEDVVDLLPSFYPLRFDERITEKEVTFSLHESGHLLGSAFVRLEAENQHLTFSGDLGRYGGLFYRDPAPAGASTCLFCESTYGNSLHPPKMQAFASLLDHILTEYRQGKTILIPAFSIGRTTEVLYGLHLQARISEQLEAFLDVPIYMDSPLAIKGLDIYLKHLGTLNESFEPDLLDLPNLKRLEEAEQSYALDKKMHPKVILSAGGMAQGGHILHHLKRFLPLETTTVIFVGYQGEDTLGRQILNGDRDVLIEKSRVHSNAKVIEVSGFSGHGDRQDLLQWIESSQAHSIVLGHGEPEVIEHFRQTLLEKGYSVQIAEHSKTISL